MRAIVVIALLVFLFTFAEAKEKILVTGSSTVAPLVAELAKSFTKQSPDVRIEVQTGGSAKGITDCRQHLSDLGMISRSLKPDESDVVATPIARDGLAFIVHESNPVQGLTSEQILKIYTGAITNWKELGGPDLKVVVISKAEGRAALELFMQYFKVKSSQIKASAIVGDEEQVVKTVAASPGAVGYLSVSTAQIAVEAKSRVNPLSLDGAAPTMQVVRSGKYGISRYLNIVTCKDPDAVAKKFVAYMTSGEGQKVIEKLKYIPL